MYTVPINNVYLCSMYTHRETRMYIHIHRKTWSLLSKKPCEEFKGNPPSSPSTVFCASLTMPGFAFFPSWLLWALTGMLFLNPFIYLYLFFPSRSHSLDCDPLSCFFNWTVNSFIFIFIYIGFVSFSLVYWDIIER